MSEVKVVNMEDIERKLSYGLSLYGGDVVLVKHEQQVADDKYIKNTMLMLVHTRHADNNENEAYTELIEIGGSNSFKFSRRLITNQKYRDEEYGLHILDIIGKCDIDINIKEIHSL